MELADSLNTKTEPASDFQAVAMAAAVNENKTYWKREGTYRVVVNGQEFVVELEKEMVRIR